MPKKKGSLNTVYISERLQSCLLDAFNCPLTTVVAPMGYGKTTAVNWLLGKREETSDAGRIGVIRISVYSENLAIFWRSVQNGFAAAGLEFLREYECPNDTASAAFLTEELCCRLGGEKIWYLFLDDFHLLKDSRGAEFLCRLARQLPENVHMILASRDRVLSERQLLALGGRVYQIHVEQLRLREAEIAAYAYRSGIELTQEQLQILSHATEGWFSAVYLSLQTLSERRTLPDSISDIYGMFFAAMMEPLAEKRQEFLTVMGLADEFSVEMAQFVTKQEEAAALLKELTEQNAFVKRLPDGQNYRFHHMMKECAERKFRSWDTERQRVYQKRYGAWYEKQSLYLHALASYRAGKDLDGALRVIQKDAGILLASLKPAEVLGFLEECPSKILKEHPFALLVLMRSMFNWGQIPKMLELKTLLLESIAEHPEWSPTERGNLAGECDLILSFLSYNDITQMSRLHRSASAQMSRPAISIRKNGGWTFGSPSVLWMFHREPGNLSKELAEMEECMPHYYQITDGHGRSAERTMSGEAAYMQGRFVDAHIELERAYAQIEGREQENMALCCDFLQLRLSLCMDVEAQLLYTERLEQVRKQHNVSWLNLWNSSYAYYSALLGEEKRIPELFRTHELNTVNFLAPGRPMMELIENQVYLAQGNYAKVIARSEQQLTVCTELHYGLVALQIRVQAAAAYEQLGKRSEVLRQLREALAEAEPDGLVMPFVENTRYLKAVFAELAKREQNELLVRVMVLGEQYEAQCSRMREGAERQIVFAALTDREYDIVQLLAKRLSNREIAEKLYLSEGSVKQYTNQIYAKLGIEGDVRSKRKRVLELLESDS